jgi:hypothetical protein
MTKIINEIRFYSSVTWLMSDQILQNRLVTFRRLSAIDSLCLVGVAKLASVRILRC